MFACFVLLEIFVYIDVEQEKLKRQTRYLPVLTTSLVINPAHLKHALLNLQDRYIEVAAPQVVDYVDFVLRLVEAEAEAVSRRRVVAHSRHVQTSESPCGGWGARLFKFS
jgi:hypothetical protein